MCNSENSVFEAIVSGDARRRRRHDTKKEEEPSFLERESKEVDIERKKVKLSNANLSEVSDYNLMIRVVAWMLRFIHNCRKEIRSCKNSELLFSEIDNAEKFLIHIVQKCYFPDIKCINLIDVFLDDDDNIRVKTRITERKGIPSFLAPYLLPANCTFTKLLIESVHKKNCHAGVQMLQCILRERFWICVCVCKSRRTIRSVMNKCTKCRRYKAEPMLCEPTPLPADRVENSTVFEVIHRD
ncbi:integrase catalytic domain-containing protein [Trichonephila clavipes]|nr:integrase catalytic domain-containing protein [Trichonephila clavipes]